MGLRALNVRFGNVARLPLGLFSIHIIDQNTKCLVLYQQLEKNDCEKGCNFDAYSLNFG